MTKRRGFTLIESLAVIAIIGILATLATTIALGAQRNGRDAKRKSDLYAISQSFESRVLDKTCTDSNIVGQYPVAAGAVSGWVRISTLAGQSNVTDCQDFTNYLKTIPKDPQSQIGFDYYYNLSNAPFLRKHYRLAASLERVNTSQQKECEQASEIWSTKQSGQRYDCVNTAAIQTGNRDYQYYIGK